MRSPHSMWAGSRWTFRSRESSFRSWHVGSVRRRRSRGSIWHVPIWAMAAWSRAMSPSPSGPWATSSHTTKHTPKGWWDGGRYIRHVMFGVDSLFLACRTQIIVGANSTLEPDTKNWAFASITCYTRVELTIVIRIIGRRLLLVFFLFCLNKLGLKKSWFTNVKNAEIRMALVH